MSISFKRILMGASLALSVCVMAAASAIGADSSTAPSNDNKVTALQYLPADSTIYFFSDNMAYTNIPELVALVEEMKNLSQSTQTLPVQQDLPGSSAFSASLDFFPVESGGVDCKIKIFGVTLLDNPEDTEKALAPVIDSQFIEMLQQALSTQGNFDIQFEEKAFQEKKAFLYSIKSPELPIPINMRIVQESDTMISFCIAVNCELPEESPFPAEPQPVNPLMETTNTVFGIAVLPSALCKQIMD